MDRRELWKRAREDASFAEDEAVWAELPGTAKDRDSDTLAGVAGPHAGHPQGLPLDDETERWSSENREKWRIITFAGIKDTESLATMRWALEYARLDRDYNAAMQLIRVTHVASQDRIIALGKGGASYHHMAPEQRQSNAAASVLVKATFGEQVGEYYTTFGPLFRNFDDAMTDELFGRRAVAFASFHREDIEAWEPSHVRVAPLVDAVDPAAASWWDTLRADDAFQRLAAAGRVVMPNREETEAAMGAARLLWDTASDLYRRGERRALEVLPIS